MIVRNARLRPVAPGRGVGMCCLGLARRSLVQRTPRADCALVVIRGAAE